MSLLTGESVGLAVGLAKGNTHSTLAVAVMMVVVVVVEATALGPAAGADTRRCCMRVRARGGMLSCSDPRGFAGARCRVSPSEERLGLPGGSGRDACESGVMSSRDDATELVRWRWLKMELNDDLVRDEDRERSLDGLAGVAVAAPSTVTERRLPKGVVNVDLNSENLRYERPLADAGADGNSSEGAGVRGSTDVS